VQHNPVAGTYGNQSGASLTLYYGRDAVLDHRTRVDIADSLVHNTRMRKLLWICALAAAGLTAADNQLTREEKKQGWKLLFDGKSYAGWEDPGKKSPPGDSFAIEDGTLKALAHCQINEDLFTRDTWSDFELQLDW